MSKAAKEFRELSLGELATKRREFKEELLNLRVQRESGQLDNSARMRTVRRNIARVETEMTVKRAETAQA
ncbi:MAG: 50S ribosomal protein L29 [Verrucomicrobiota bacterium]